MYKILILLLYLSKSNGICSIESTDTISTQSGLIIGKYSNTVINSMCYAAYKGIPYAEPPINNLRFKPPVEKSPWNDTLNAFDDPDKCIQLENGNVVGTEDCLYLNVYTPKISQTDENLKPVIVWIHGGAFRTGNGNSSYYGPGFLIEEDVVVVSVQYRLGAFGFLNLNHPGATGNAGLKDQNLALQWINKNIEYFGGDPNQVTLLGQSAGGVSVDLHKLSDMSRGLFKQTIVMSASPLCIYWAFQRNSEAKQQALLLGKELGHSTKTADDLLEFLLQANASDIIKATNQLTFLPFRPTIEDVKVAPNEPKFLDMCTPKKYRNGDYNKAPHLMGFTSSEILEFAETPDDLVAFTTIATKIIDQNSILGSLPYVPQILSLPFDGLTSLTKAALNEVIEELSDLFFVTGIDYKQQLMNDHNEYPVYYYRFSFKSPYSAHKSYGVKYLDGVAHEDDLAYIFYRPFLNLPLNDDKIATTRNRLVKMWTNFAKYSNPTPHGENDSLLGVNWLPAGNSGKHLEIGENLIVKDRPTNKLVPIYQSLHLGDSSVLNDCEKSSTMDFLSDLIIIPTTIQNTVKNVISKGANIISSILNL